MEKGDWRKGYIVSCEGKLRGRGGRKKEEKARALGCKMALWEEKREE